VVSVSLSKTKGLAVGAEIGEDGVSPVELEGSVTEMAFHFTNLCSILSADREVTGEVNC